MTNEVQEQPAGKAPRYFPLETYPFLEELVPHREAIFDELRVNEDKWQQYPTTGSLGGWTVLPLIAFGNNRLGMSKQFPRTMEAISRMPGLTAAGFSRMAPGQWLGKHQGPGVVSNYCLRAHFGLDVPSGNFLHVEDDTREYKQDEFLIFDDSKMHWVENLANRSRTVLIMDFKRPDWVPAGTSRAPLTEGMRKMLSSAKISEL